MAQTGLLPIEQSTDLVTYTINVDGQPLEEPVQVLSIVVTKEFNRIPSARICIADGDTATGDFAVSSGELFVPGKPIEILAGYHGQDEPIFSGIVIKQSIRVRQQRMELVVECKDPIVKLTLAPNSRYFLEKKDSEIAEEILGNLAGQIETTKTIYPEVVQMDVNDWDFLVGRIEANGMLCHVRDGKVSTVKPATDGETVAVLVFGDNLFEFDAELDARDQFGSVVAQAWDPSNQALLEVTAQPPETWELGGNLAPADLATAVGLDTYTLRHPGRLSNDELQAWADGYLLRSRMAHIRGRGRVNGFALAEPGIVVELAGVGDRFSGKAYVTGVRHDISGGDWLSDIQFGWSKEAHAQRYPSQPQAASLLPPVSGLHTAVVTALEADPEKQFRIQVKIPSVNTTEPGIWARYASPDAGKGRGMLFLPEIGDEVVVGFVNEDVRHPIVLGMLYSKDKSHPLDFKDDNHKKGYVSRSGIKMTFDDDKKNLTIETPGGRQVLLDDDKGVVQIKDSNGNQLKMSADGITIESAKDLIFKAKGDIQTDGEKNIATKAGTQLKMEGTAGTELKSGAVTTIKGSLVKIN